MALSKDNGVHFHEPVISSSGAVPVNLTPVASSSQARSRCAALRYAWPVVSVKRGSERSRTIQLQQLTSPVATASAVGAQIPAPVVRRIHISSIYIRLNKNTTFHCLTAPKKN